MILQKELKSWFAELNVDMDKVQEIARAITNLYELWKTFDEKKEIQELLGKMPKPKPAPQRWFKQRMAETSAAWDPFHTYFKDIIRTLKQITCINLTLLFMAKKTSKYLVFNKIE